MEISNKRFLTPSELEELLGFSKSWQSKARMASNSCSLPFVKIGKYVRYDRMAIEKWLEQHQVQGDVA